jgi:hypothetical protein
MTVRQRPPSRVHFSERRRQNGVTLADIARRTKIPLPLLEDLEHERFDRFPAGIFARAYVRAYAAEAGLDQDVVMARVIRKLPGDEALSDVNALIDGNSGGRRSMPAVTRPFLRLRHVTTSFAAAAVILVALGTSVTETGGSIAARMHELISPPLTNGELRAAALPQADQAQVVGAGSSGPAPSAVDGETTDSLVGFQPVESGVQSRRPAGLPSRAPGTARRISAHKSRSRMERVFSGVGGVFKKLFTGDGGDKHRKLGVVNSGRTEQSRRQTRCSAGNTACR